MYHELQRFGVVGPWLADRDMIVVSYSWNLFIMRIAADVDDFLVRTE